MPPWELARKWHNANRLAAAFAKKFEIQRASLNWATSINGVSNNCVLCVVNIFCYIGKSFEELSLETASFLLFFFRQHDI